MNPKEYKQMMDYLVLKEETFKPLIPDLEDNEYDGPVIVDGDEIKFENRRSRTCKGDVAVKPDAVPPKTNTIQKFEIGLSRKTT